MDVCSVVTTSKRAFAERLVWREGLKEEEKMPMVVVRWGRCQGPRERREKRRVKTYEGVLLLIDG